MDIFRSSNGLFDSVSDTDSDSYDKWQLKYRETNVCVIKITGSVSNIVFEKDNSTLIAGLT